MNEWNRKLYIAKFLLWWWRDCGPLQSKIWIVSLTALSNNYSICPSQNINGLYQHHDKDRGLHLWTLLDIWLQNDKSNELFFLFNGDWYRPFKTRSSSKTMLSYNSQGVESLDQINIFTWSVDTNNLIYLCYRNGFEFIDTYCRLTLWWNGQSLTRSIFGNYK